MTAAPNHNCLILVRHGQTDYNATKRFQGQGNMSLNSTGKEEVRRSGEIIANILQNMLKNGSEIKECLTSDLQRTLETSEVIKSILYNRLNLNFEFLQENSLREFHTGSLSDLTFEESQEKYPQEIANYLEKYKHDFYNAKFPGDLAESRAIVIERLAPIVQKLNRSSLSSMNFFPTSNTNNKTLLLQELQNSANNTPFSSQSADYEKKNYNIYLWITHGGIIDTLYELLNTNQSRDRKPVGNGDVLLLTPTINFANYSNSSAEIKKFIDSKLIFPLAGTYPPTSYCEKSACLLGWKILRHYPIGNTTAASLVR